ncbi:DUF3887 domain-containing protein [Lysinibacillus sp. BW-2-10]|uniref:S-layer homology domain-containing protein n=1 Tax=Lysinibacillus sp. BW-2-10 TaxID=2590030 RepID=UPI0011801D39|nr:DUF3887 domain-containing protein [Lysinibacillus sp. BW-2-10]TSI11672.1 DUF3887 domain-containing protein [Lysinibacillus sp. BW-2-10]
MSKKSLRKIILATTLGVAGVGGSVFIQEPAFAQEVTAKVEYETKAKEFLNFALEGNWDSAYNYLNDNLKAVASKDIFQLSWNNLSSSFGKIKSSSIKDIKQMGLHTRVTFTVIAENSPFELFFNLDKDGKIDDMTVVFPAGPVQYVNPSYDHPENYTEQEVLVGEGTFTLPGVLTLPKGDGPFPVVVLVQGSGPHDMDESFFGFKPFKDIAVGLANEGIAVLRYEKRTMTHPIKTASNPKMTIQEETVLDANFAVEKLKKIPQIDSQNIFVLGHSQGAFALPFILENDKNGDIKGGIVAAGPAGKFQDLLLWQNEQSLVRAKQEGAPKEQLEALEANLAFWKEQVGLINNPQYSTENPPPNFQLGSPNWWFEMRDFEAPKFSATQDVPLFVIQGGKDFQVPADHLNEWKSTLKDRDNVEYQLYPNMHHFLVDNVNATSTPTDYYTPGNVPETLLKDISQWVKTGEFDERPVVNLSEYKDYKENQYWSEAFAWAIQEGIIKGYQNEKLLKPNEALNESQYLTVFFQYALGDQISEDIYTLAKEKGFPVKGNASAGLSRGEVAVLLAKSITNKDMSETESVQWLYENKILFGSKDINGNVSMQLNESITRAQFVTMLHRIHQANLLSK